jgi:predicted nucleotidyltransferase
VPADIVKAVHRSLEAAGIPHAFGGALALALYAESRETADIDVNVFVPVEQWPEVREALMPLGVDVNVDEEELKRQAEVKVNWNGTPVHLFFSSDLLHEEMPRKVKQAPLDGHTIPLVAPEHLIVRKTMLDRPKDRRDIERILATTPVDRDEVDNWVRRLA